MLFFSAYMWKAWNQGHLSTMSYYICHDVCVCVCLFVCYSIGYFPSVERSYSPNLFMFSVIAVLAVAALSCKKTDTVSV